MQRPCNRFRQLPRHDFALSINCRRYKHVTRGHYQPTPANMWTFTSQCAQVILPTITHREGRQTHNQAKVAHHRGAAPARHLLLVQMTAASRTVVHTDTVCMALHRTQLALQRTPAATVEGFTTQKRQLWREALNNIARDEQSTCTKGRKQGHNQKQHWHWPAHTAALQLPWQTHLSYIQPPVPKEVCCQKLWHVKH
jgi:hypothetical protein